MESIQLLLKSAVLISPILAIMAGVGVLLQIRKAQKDVHELHQSSIRQALFLYNTAPGRSSMATFNSPDQYGLGMLAALSFMHVGAMDFALEQVTINQKLYVGTEMLYTTSALVAHANGNSLDAQNYLGIAKTVRNPKDLAFMPQYLTFESVEQQIMQPATVITDAGKVDLVTAYDNLPFQDKLMVVSARIAVISVAITVIAFFVYALIGLA